MTEDNMCSMCKCVKLPHDFLNIKGQKIKSCIKCRSRFKCVLCEFKCSSNSNLQRHITLCIGDLKISCGEKMIIDTLTKMKIKYKFNQKYKGSSNSDLRFNFYIKKYNVLIEYNGIQHYEYVCFGGISKERALINFEKQKNKDISKRNFCKENKIKLLEISYKKFGYITQIIADFLILHGWSE
jgi:hypothetical protein